MVPNGRLLPDPDPRGHPVVDDTFLLLFNAHYEPVTSTTPTGWADEWTPEFDTARVQPVRRAPVLRAGATDGRPRPGASRCSG